MNIGDRVYCRGRRPGEIIGFTSDCCGNQMADVRLDKGFAPEFGTYSRRDGEARVITVLTSTLRKCQSSQ